MDSLLNINDSLRHWFVTEAAGFLIHLAGGLLVFLFFYLSSIVSRWLLIRIGEKRGDTTGIYILISGVSKAALNIFGAVTALGTLGVDVSALVAGLGLTGFAVGFATKDILSNVIAGFLIIMYQPIKIKQNVVISGHEGSVSSINIRYTTLSCTEEGKKIKILIPNYKIFQEVIRVS